jgi:hypothetical protein
VASSIDRPAVVAKARRPTQAEADMLGVYQDAERALLQSVTGGVRDLVEGPDDSLDARRAAGVRQVQQAAQGVFAGLERGAARRVDAVLGAADQQGAAAAAAELGAITGRGRDQYADTINRGALDRLAAALVDRLTPAHAAILRTTVDAFREVAARVLPAVLVGSDTRRIATQRALWALTDRGISAFTDKAGRKWSLSSYAEMATRSAAARATTDGKLDRLVGAGRDLVIVNGSSDRCDLCRPWSGRILSISGHARGQTMVEHGTQDGLMVAVTVAGSVDDARSAGLLHPQCRCSLSAYIPGITVTPPAPPPDNGQYAARQRQRAIERQIRGWKEREAAALDPTAQRYAASHTRAAQARMRAHLADNPDLRRISARERPGAGNSPTEGLRERVGPGGNPLRTASPVGKERAPRDMTNAELDREMQSALGVEDFDRFDHLATETDRRDAKRETDKARRAEQAAARAEARAVEMERLIGQGVDEEEAVARAYGVSVEKQRRAAAIAKLRGDGYRGESFDALSRDAYKDYAYSRYQAAEDATNGYMVNAAGRAAGASDSAFFTGSDAYVRKYATPELLEWFDLNGRPTLAEWRAELLGDAQAASRARNERGDLYQ